MISFDEFFSELVKVAVGTVLLYGALTGRFYTHKRGGGHILVASVRPLWARCLLLLAALAVLGWVILDLRRLIR